MKGVLDLAKNVLGNAAKMFVSKSVESAEQAGCQGMRVPLRGGEGDLGRGKGISMI